MKKKEVQKLKKSEVVCLIRQYYQMQKHRVSFGNQSKAFEKEEAEESEVLASYTDRSHDMEKDINKTLLYQVRGERLYEEYLKSTKGIGHIISAGIINLIDISRANHVSSLWKFAGLDVVDGKASRLRKGEKTSWNPLMKVLCWKIGKSFLMTRNQFYRDIYDARKIIEQKKSKKMEKELSDGHIHNRASRYMIKMFLRQLWIVWREMEGLPTSEPYAVAKIGGHHYNKSIDGK